MFRVITTLRESLPRSICVCRWAMLLGVALVAHVAAQETQEPDQGETQKEGYYHRTADGFLIPLSSLGVEDGEVEKLIRGKQADTPPQYVISAASLKGRIEGNLAYIDATLSIQLNVEEGRWISVPVAMNEGKLADKWTYNGDGKAVFDRKRTTESGIRHWFFQGSGKHELTLPLIVPVREPQHLRHTLRLRLPDAAATRLSLKVPAGNITVQPPKGAGLRTSRAETGTQIDLWGLGTQFSLEWDVRPDVVNSRPVLRSLTDLTANLATDPFSITATQTLVMQQGSLSTIDISLPAGMVVRNTEPQQIDPTGRVSLVEADEEPGKVRVTFAEPLTDRVELTWSLAAEDSEVARRWKFTGFLVANAQEQTTKLELTPPEGVAVQPVKSVGVQNVRANRSDQRTTRCRLLSPESEFTVELRDVEPFYTITPRTVLYFSEDQARIESRFRVRVLRGSVQELKLVWPGIRNEDWKLLPSPPTENLADWTSSELADDESLTLNLLTRMAGTFEVSVGAVRTLTNPEGFSVSLPGIVSETRQPTTVVLATDSNVDVEFTDGEKTVSAPIPFDARMVEDFEQSTATLQNRALLVRSDLKHFTAQLRTRQREVTTSTAVVLDVKEEAINVEENLNYQLDFDHIAELRFTIPDGIDASVALEDGTALRRLAVGPNTSRFALPEPMTGNFEVQIRYRVPFLAEDSTAEIPIILSADSPNGDLRVGVKPGAKRKVTPIGKWKPVFSRQLEAEWIADQPTDALSLKLDSPLSGTARQFAVTRALVQSKVTGSEVKGRVSFVLRGQFLQQTLNVPESTRIYTVSWNGVPLPRQQWNVDRLVGTEILTVTQRQLGGSGILAIDFGSSAPQLSWSRRLTASCPTMPDDTPVDDVIWQVILPSGEHLSGFDKIGTPCFEWSFGSFGWSRQPTEEFEDLSLWLRQGTSRDSRTVQAVAGNAFAFQLPSLKSGLRLSTVDQSFVLLFGSGVAFLAAFALIRFSPRRFAIAIPIAGVLISVLSIRYAPAIKLLLQPAVLGLALAAIAHRIDRKRYRRGYGTYSMEQKPTVAISTEPVTASHAVVAPGSSQ